MSASSLTPSGAYLIENGSQIVLFIGQDIDPSWLREMFGSNVNTVQEVPVDGQVYEDEILSNAHGKCLDLV